MKTIKYKRARTTSETRDAAVKEMRELAADLLFNSDMRGITSKSATGVQLRRMIALIDIVDADISEESKDIFVKIP